MARWHDGKSGAFLLDFRDMFVRRIREVKIPDDRFVGAKRDYSGCPHRFAIPGQGTMSAPESFRPMQPPASGSPLRPV